MNLPWRLLPGMILAWQFCNVAPADQGDNQSGKSSQSSQTSSSETQTHINQLIEQLGDRSYIKREAAKTELESYGLLAFESLSAAEMHPNVEIAHTATYLLQSMRVVWTLPTDSFDVQRLLKEYNDYSGRNKSDALQRLAKLGRSDGYLALLRLVRYEKDERVSKNAALYVMEAAVNARKTGAIQTGQNDAAKSQPGKELRGRSAKSIDWPQLVASGLGDSNRVAASWLLTLGNELRSPNTELAAWHAHVLHERMLLESNARTKSSQSQTDDQIVKQLYRNVAQLMVSEGRRDEALVFFEPCLELVAKDKSSAFNDIQWMLEAGLPEAVIALDAQRPDLLKDRSRNRFLLAESYLKLGRDSEAQAIAKEASDLSVVRAGNNGVNPVNTGDFEARQRDENFDFLVERSLFDWAEAELVRILEKDVRKGEYSAVSELKARDKLSRFYWDGGQPDKAAQVWEPLLVRAGLLEDAKPATPDKDLLSEMNLRVSGDAQYITQAPSRYYFYLGLAASKVNNWPLARKQLVKALEYDNGNPDILIAMHRAVQGDETFQQTVTAGIDRLETAYREEIARGESDVAQSVSRNIRQDHERALAEQLNQLAWLLAGTERKSSEAVSLSQRSLVLHPDEPVYLDTLARCYFADKQIERAIQLQQRAVDLMPYERSMRRQLEEFKSATK